ncbi:MAG: PIG-L family deacetylase [Chitinispirillaceae bacterium]|nr:PIG-L family deacetylase [Chitinispirillaceae bacterium]
MNKKPKKILAIGSHPDDIEFGCGGSLAQFVRQGHDVFMLVCTNGSSGGNPKVRKREQLASARSLGVKQVFWGGYTDTHLPFYRDVITVIENVVSEVVPTHVFVHHGKDTHQDHRHVTVSAVAATRNVPNVLFYEGPTSYDFEPNVFFNIGPSLQGKFKSLSCHKSQVTRTNINGQSILDIARATAVFRGTQCRIPFAEAFSSLRMFLSL